MATSGGRRFADDDEEARYWLDFLRSGTPESKIEARDHLSRIFERRGLLAEAIELLETNGREHGRDADHLGRLGELYRRAGRDDDADAAFAEAHALDAPEARLGVAETGPDDAVATAGDRVATAPRRETGEWDRAWSDADRDSEDLTTQVDVAPGQVAVLGAAPTLEEAGADRPPPHYSRDASDTSVEDDGRQRAWFAAAPALSQSVPASGRERRAGTQVRRPSSNGTARRNGATTRRGVPSRSASTGWTPAAIGLAIFLLTSVVVALATAAISLSSNGPPAALDSASLPVAGDSAAATTDETSGRADPLGMPPPLGGSLATDATPSQAGAVTRGQIGSTSGSEARTDGSVVESPAGALPSPTPVPIVDPAAIRAYNTDVSPKLIVANATSARMSGLARRVSEKPELLGDPAWKRDMTAVLLDLRSIGQQLQRQQNVPAPADAVNGLVVGMGQDLVYVADELQAGIDGVNARRLQNAMTRANEVNGRVPTITNQLQALSTP